MADKKTMGERSLSRDLLTLYDDYTELNACYAFFCDAVAAIHSTSEGSLDNTSAEGLCFFSQWMKDRSVAFKEDLNVVWRTASSHERH